MRYDFVPEPARSNRQSKGRRWTEYLVICVSLAGAFGVAVTLYQHTAHESKIAIRLVWRGFILFLIALVALLDLLIPKGPNSSR